MPSLSVNQVSNGFDALSLMDNLGKSKLLATYISERKMTDDNHTPRDRRILMSERSRQLNGDLHRRDPMYGTTARRHVETIRNLARRYSAQSVLDYGCGKCDLWKGLSCEFDIRNFDPAIPEFAASPEPAELIACIDVLEHVEPDYLQNVLADLARVTTKVAYFTIATRLSGKSLADGSNCHRIIESPQWWRQFLGAHFQLVSAADPVDGNSLQVTVIPLGKMSLFA